MGAIRAETKALLSNKHISFGIGVVINEETKFEGRNRIGKFSSLKGSQIGFCSYIGDGCHLSNTIIGRYCSIANNVKGITGAHPVNEFVSSHPAFYAPNNMVGFSYVDKLLFNEHKLTDNGFSVSIGNDVWIGSESNILEGVTINNGAIVASGSMVVKDVPPYAIVGGVPAKVIKYRFSDDEIKGLMGTKWWDLKPKDLETLKDCFNNIPLFIERVDALRTSMSKC